MRRLLAGLCVFFAITTLGLSGAREARAEAFQLDDRLGVFGEVDDVLRGTIEDLVVDSGLQAAAQQAQAAFVDLQQGKVPVVGSLQDPFHGQVEQSVELAVAQAQIVATSLSRIVDAAAGDVLQAINQEIDFGITLPTGRLRVIKRGLETSVCLTLVGPGYSRVVVGLSNASRLCNSPDARMANPPVIDGIPPPVQAVVDMAVGYSHVQARQALTPVLGPPQSLVAETFVNINGQWVRLRFAGPDPQSLTVEAEFTLGLMGTFDYVVSLNAGFEAALRLSLKPFVAAEVITGAVNVMTARAQSMGTSMGSANAPAVVADLIQTALDYLEEAEKQFGGDDGFGDVSVSVGAAAGVGVGIVDTSIDVVSAGNEVTVSVPLAALLSAGAGAVSNFLTESMRMTDASLGLGVAIFNNEAGEGLQVFAEAARTSSSNLVLGALTSLMTVASSVELEMETTVDLLGGTPVFRSGVEIPVGAIFEALVTHPEMIGDAAIALGNLVMVMAGQSAQVDLSAFDTLYQNTVAGISVSLMSANPLTGGAMIGIREVDLHEILSLLAGQAEIGITLIGGIGAAAHAGSIDPLRDALEGALALGEQWVFDLLNTARIAYSAGLGLEGTIGAEARATIGGGFAFEVDLRTSLFLLLLDWQHYAGVHEDDLFKISLPIDFSVNAGASVGEFVELDVGAGASIAQNLFDLRMTHWDGPLPQAAGMTVAGFPLLEFDGTVNNDTSFSGEGILMLPQGGVATATFAVDQNGHVTEGRWWGGFDLGPLGEVRLAEGELDDAGLHGNLDIDVPGATVSVEYLLTSSGLLFGTYDGDLSLAGHTFSSLHLELGSDGKFAGEGTLDLGGFDAEATVTLDGSGFTGSAHVDLLGQRLEAENFAISSTGEVSGTFTGQLLTSSVELEIVAGGLAGTAVMDLPGIANAVLEMHVSGGAVWATYAGDLLGLSSGAEVRFTPDGMTLSASFIDGLLGTLNTNVLALITAAADEATRQLDGAIALVEQAQGVVDGLEAEIDAMRQQVLDERAVLLDKVADAERVAQDALTAVQVALAEIDRLKQLYQKPIADAENLVNYWQAEVNRLKSVIAYWDDRLRRLHAWYDGLSDWDQFWKAGYYAAKVLEYGGYKVVAEGLLVTANGLLDGAKLALAGVRATLNGLIDGVGLPVLNAVLNTARQALASARQALEAIAENPDLDPRVIALRILLGAAKLALDGAELALQTLRDTLLGALAEAEHIADGLAGLFQIHSASFTANLDPHAPLGKLTVVADVTYLGERRWVTGLVDPNDLLGGFTALAKSLQPVPPEEGEDTQAPTATASAPAGWQKDAAMVQLSASDAGGSGVASITWSASGAQAAPATTVDGATASVLVTAAGTTTVTYFATDRAGNTSAAQAVTVQVDSTAPVIVITLPADPGLVPYTVQVAADDGNGSGLALLGITASGANAFAEQFVEGGSATLTLARSGDTLLTVRAVDSVGNVRVFGQVVTVPDTVPPVLTVPDDLTVEANAPLSTVEIGTAIATDDVDGEIEAVSNAPESFPLGTTVVTWTATDAAGNTASATQRVTVVDTTPPELETPVDLELEATAVLTPVVLGEPAVFDLVGVASVGHDAPGAFPLGTTTVTWTATDTEGNSTSATQTVTVVDTTPPELEVPADVSVTATGELTEVAIGEATASDIFAPVTVTSDAPASYPPGTTTVTWTATDANGNVSTATQRVTVRYVASGFLPPLKQGAVHKAGRAVPVKFMLAYADGTPVTDATATLAVYPAPAGGADPGAAFRTSDDQYILNLATRGWPAGTYTLVATASDGTEISLVITLR